MTKRTTRPLAFLLALSCVVVFAVGPAAAPAARSPDGPFEYVGWVDGRIAAWPPPFASDGTRLVTTQKEDSARVWDARTLKPLAGPLPHPGLTWWRLSGDGKTVVTAGGTAVRVWDVAASKPLSDTRVSGQRLRFADISADCTRFVTVSRDDPTTAKVWRAGDEQPAAALQHRSAVLSAEFDPGGGRVVTQEWDSPAFHAWDAAGNEHFPPVADDEAVLFAPYRARLDPPGGRLAVPRAQGFAVIDLGTGKTLAEGRWDGEGDNREVRFGGDGTKVAVLSSVRLDPGPVRVFDAGTGAAVRTLRPGTRDCEISPDGGWLLCVAPARKPYSDPPADGPQLWDLATGSMAQAFPAPIRGGQSEAHLSPDGTLLAISSTFTTPEVTTVWHLRGGEKVGGPRK